VGKLAAQDVDKIARVRWSIANDVHLKSFSSSYAFLLSPPPQQICGALCECVCVFRKRENTHTHIRTHKATPIIRSSSFRVSLPLAFLHSSPHRCTSSFLFRLL
jgi:hypothetical protein